MCLHSEQITRQDKLRGFLAERRLNQRKLADMLGVSEAYMGQILSGKRKPKHYIERLINLGIPSDFLPDKSE